MLACFLASGALQDFCPSLSHPPGSELKLLSRHSFLQAAIRNSCCKAGSQVKYRYVMAVAVVAGGPCDPQEAPADGDSMSTGVVRCHNDINSNSSSQTSCCSICEGLCTYRCRHHHSAPLSTKSTSINGHPVLVDVRRKSHGWNNQIDDNSDKHNT